MVLVIDGVCRSDNGVPYFEILKTQVQVRPVKFDRAAKHIIGRDDKSTGGCRVSLLREAETVFPHCSNLLRGRTNQQW